MKQWKLLPLVLCLENKPIVVSRSLHQQNVIEGHCKQGTQECNPALIINRCVETSDDRTALSASPTDCSMRQSQLGCDVYLTRLCMNPESALQSMCGRQQTTHR